MNEQAKQKHRCPVHLTTPSKLLETSDKQLIRPVMRHTQSIRQCIIYHLGQTDIPPQMTVRAKKEQA